MTRFLLASASPRRRELFGLLGLPFEIASADVNESPLPGETPAEMVVRLAQAKAETVARSLIPSGDAMVIAADTTVSLDGVSLGKPVDEADAWRMLRALRGRTHQVHTGLALLGAHAGRAIVDLTTTDVPMRDYGDDEIAAYIASGDPFDKAGGYAIQHEGFHPVSGLAGCFANVMGLPLCHLTSALHTLGIEPLDDIADLCRPQTVNGCVIWARFLNRS